jgi:tetratricopeptide (TPR) repeat protein
MGNEEFEELLEQSSLGSRGARQLRARVPHDQVVLTRRIADLRNQMVHGDAPGNSAAAAELISYLTELGYHDQAAAVLQEWFQPAIQSTSTTGDVSQEIWEEAEARLRTSRDRHLRAFGAHHLITLTTSVAHAYLLIALGRAVEAESVLRTTLPHLRKLVGPSGRDYLRATFLLGNALAQQGLHEPALHCFQEAFAGQLGLLGLAHVETLHSAYALAIAKKLTGDTPGARGLIRAVLDHAPQKRSDLYARAVIANVLLALPAVVWRGLAAPAARKKADRRLLSIIDEVDQLDEDVTEEQLHDTIARLIEYADVATA